MILHIFGEVFVDLVPKVAQIPWGFGFGLMGPSLRGPIGPIGPYKGPNRALIGPYYVPSRALIGPY